MKENANGNAGTRFVPADVFKEKTPPFLCSGCWPEEELEAYLKQSREKRESEKPFDK